MNNVYKIDLVEAFGEDHAQFYGGLLTMTAAHHGVEASVTNGVFSVSQGNLTPTQWAQLIAVIATLALSISQIIGGGGTGG